MNLDDGVGVNAAMFADFSDGAFITAALAPYDSRYGPVVVTGEPAFRPDIPAARRLSPAQVGLDHVPIDVAEVTDRLRGALAAIPGPSAVIIDMTWSLDAMHGAESFSVWGKVAETLSGEMTMAFLSLFDKEMMIESQMLSALRAHRQFLAPSGLYENPFWLPYEMQQDGTQDEQIGFMLGRVVPDFAEGPLFANFEREAARGAAPNWLAEDRKEVSLSVSSGRWQISCLGRLRVQIGPNRVVDWHVKGSAPKKTRALFAYLLQSGTKGAHVERIGEILWPDRGSETAKNARLHYTVTMLRKALGSADAVLREDDYYRLNPPVGSGTDIASFEQLCRRGFSLARNGQMTAAVRIYFAADRLYGGDLFEDLPQEYVENEHDDWCLPRRMWLREMAVRLQYDFSNLLRQSGRFGEALEHVQKALALDPTSEAAHCEILRVYFTLGRIEAMHRHFRRMKADESEMQIEGTEIPIVYDELCRDLRAMSADQKRAKVMALRAK